MAILAQEQATGDMVQSILNNLTPIHMVVLIVLIIYSSNAICEIAKQIRLFACHRQELGFKREMIDRGLDGQEIELVMNATSPPDRGAEAKQTFNVSQ